tara:strand:- start:171 stop:461 length:291 start_codon:yes stop_codon:yes gene_type:complete
MKQLISATLSKEAAQIYNSWRRQHKSRILSELIEDESNWKDNYENLLKGLNEKNAHIVQLMIHIKLKEGYIPLLHDINHSLYGTLYFQNWESEDLK